MLNCIGIGNIVYFIAIVDRQYKVFFYIKKMLRQYNIRFILKIYIEHFQDSLLFVYKIYIFLLLIILFELLASK